MRTNQELVENWLARRTGTALEDFGHHILVTDFNDRPMPNATAESIQNDHARRGRASAATEMDLLSAIGPRMRSWPCASRSTAAADRL